MKPSSSTSKDGISIDMLQRYLFGIDDVLLDVINSSLLTGCVPASWKEATIIPIPKGKVTRTPADTRPISILPAIMKLVEKIVQQQLIEYFESHHLLSHHQHGYRRFHSTETALNVITDRALLAMDRGEISILTLLDQSKCFDVVPHQILLDKLQTYGVDIEWFENYLSDHTQRVLLRGVDRTILTSSVRQNSIGVYQGGSLSCILYSLFSNDLGLHVGEDVTVVQYADDVQVLVSGKKQDMPRLTATMEGTLETLYQWFCQHRMKVNEAKTKMIVIGTAAMLRSFEGVTLTFNGSAIHDSEEVKNLGVVVDRHLSYRAHVDDLSRRCTGMLIALNNARHVIPKRVLPTLIQALVISTIRYCMSVYGSANAQQLKRVQKLINFCARVVTGRTRYDRISDAVVRLGWMNAKQLSEYHAVTAVQTALVTALPESIYVTMEPPANVRHNHDTRGATRHTVPRIKTESGRRRLCYRGVTFLNATHIRIKDRRFR